MEEEFERLSVAEITEPDRNATIIQKTFRGYNFRINRLPIIFYRIKAILEKENYDIKNECKDGRLNSAINESMVINILKEYFGKRIRKSGDRMWHDMVVKDYRYGWLPVNIKITTTKTNDNIGNFALCVHSYTDIRLNLGKRYKNGEMSKLFIDKILSGIVNKIHKKDYYFVVINKRDKSVIINSMKGITHIKHNANNLPFQINWQKNKEFIYRPIDDVVGMVMECLKKMKPSWRMKFIERISQIG